MSRQDKYNTRYKNQSVRDKKANLLFLAHGGRSIGMCSCCFRHTPIFQGETESGERWLETHHLAPKLFPAWLIVVCNRCHLGKLRSHTGLCLHNKLIWNSKLEINHPIIILAALGLSAWARFYCKRERRKYFPSASDKVKTRTQLLTLRSLLKKAVSILFNSKPNQLIRSIHSQLKSKLNRNQPSRTTTNQPEQEHSSTHPNFFD